MRAAVVIACCVLAGCSREERASNEVDLNAAASQAQGDIANYAASRHARPHRSPVRPITDAGSQ